MSAISRNRETRRLVDLYNEYFEIVPAASEELRKEVYRMRFQVLAVEHNYFEPDSLPGGMEIDEFDPHSVHFLLRHRPSGAWAGTVRLVLPKENDGELMLPIHEVCTEPVLKDPSKFPIQQSAEISRLSISKDFRRRVTDTSVPYALADDEAKQYADDTRQVVPYMCMGLVQAMVQACADNEKTHISAIMERQFLRLLGRVGIRLTEIGPQVDLYGWRQPCFRHFGDLLDDVKREHPEIWEILTNEGSLRIG